EDGSELYVFTNGGRHLRTLDALTAALRYQFAYNSASRVTSVTDGDGNVTTIQRDTSGNPTAIVSPYGQRKALALDSNGYVARITTPASEAVALTYGSGGLLATFTDS